MTNFFDTAAVAKKSSSNNFQRKDYGVHDAGSHVARIVQVLMLGTQTRKPFKGEEKPPIQMMRVTFETPYATIERELEDGTTETQPRWISREFPVSSFDASLCVKWGKLLGFGTNWGKAINVPCQIYIAVDEAKDGSGKKFAKIKDIMPVPQGMQVPELNDQDKTLLFSPQDGSPASAEAFNNFPQWLQDKIEAAIDWNGSGLQRTLAGTPPPASKQDTPVAKETTKPQETATPVADSEDPWA